MGLRDFLNGCERRSGESSLKCFPLYAGWVCEELWRCGFFFLGGGGGKGILDHFFPGSVCCRTVCWSLWISRCPFETGFLPVSFTGMI